MQCCLRRTDSKVRNLKSISDFRGNVICNNCRKSTCYYEYVQFHRNVVLIILFGEIAGFEITWSEGGENGRKIF